MTIVPVIDLAPLRDGETGMAAVARAVDDACTNVGFLAISNHGVPAAVVDDMWRTTQAFFDLPETAKRAVLPRRVGDPYGYAAFANESLAQSLGDEAPPDLKESFSMGPLRRPARALDAGEVAFAYAETPWPSVLAGMQPAWETYYLAMERLAGRLMALFAVALRLPAHFFDDKIDWHISAMRAINYPDQRTRPKSGQLRAGAHTDYGSLTILRQDSAPGGLQVRGRDGGWHDVPYLADTFVINIGDLFAQWTNDRWMSTLHRVINPPAQAGSARRQSVAFFHTPNWAARVECLPTCLGEGAKYGPVLAGPHLMAKYQKAVSVED